MDEQGLYSSMSPYLDLDDHNGWYIFDAAGALCSSK